MSGLQILERRARSWTDYKELRECGLSGLPEKLVDFMEWRWDEIEPYFQELSERLVEAGNIGEWLSDWTALSARLQEWYSRLYVATTTDTNDRQAEQELNKFLDEIFPKVQEWEHQLKQKLLASGLEPEGFEVPLRNLRNEAEIYRTENLPLLSEVIRLNTQYDKIIGEQTVNWEGEELTIAQLWPVYRDPDRRKREQAWRMASERRLADRQAINELWGKLLKTRQQIAHNAGLPDYREYRWRELMRFDYRPEDCEQFHRAIEEAAVPAARWVNERQRQRLGVKSLRPWDLYVDPYGRPALKPYQSIAELVEKTGAIFHKLDPQLGQYFDRMREEKLLDLDNRMGKAPGGYCADFFFVRRPFIFMNAVGIPNDVQTLLHESGHAFHLFEMIPLPYLQQLQIPLEFAEIASMGMELLASPYMADPKVGIYTPQEAARALITKLEEDLRFWPYMAVVDAFQHWVYANPEAASDPAYCDAQWSELWKRFMFGVDWGGLDEAMQTGWHNRLHIHENPFYYIEYGLAQLGAIQIWEKSEQDPAKAIAAYRKALALGGTAHLPTLYATAGAKLAFDARTLKHAIHFVESKITELENVSRNDIWIASTKSIS